MNKRLLIVAVALLVLGSAAAFLFNRYANSTTTLPVATEKDFREAARKWEDAEHIPTPSVVPIDLSKPVRLAIGSLGLPDEKENLQLGTLVAAKLSRTPGLVLVERQELDQVLREMQRSLSGLVRAADAVRVGKLLKADWFLLGNAVRLDQTNFIVARVVDAKSGVMQDLALLGDTDRPLLIAEALASFARQVRETAARPALKEFLAIGQFADAGVNDRQASFPAQLRSYLMGAYQGSQTTLLEREYVDALLQEVRLDLAGLTAEPSTNDARPLQSGFWIVEGLYQSQETSGLEVEVRLRINRAFARPTYQTLRGRPDEKFFGRVKSTIDAALSNKNSNVVPTRLTESRLQMAAGSDLYKLATGGRRMQIITPGMDDPWGYSPQESPMRRRNLEEAIRAFQTVLLLEPDNLEAKFNLAACCHERSVGRIEEARGYLRELASSTNHESSQKAILSLGESFSWEDPKEATKWFNLAAAHSQSPNEANYANQLATWTIADTIRRDTRGNIATGSKELAVLIEQLEVRLRSAEDVMHEKSGVIDVGFGLNRFAEAFGKNRTGASKQIVTLLPTLRSNFPALTPHLLASVVTFLPDTNSPVYTEFLQSIESLRAKPQELLGPEIYFQNLFQITYDWCLDRKLYHLALDLISTKRKVSESVPKVTMNAEDGIRLGFVYLQSQDYTNALKAFEELGETPIVMGRNGIWGRAFTPILPAKLAAECRAKLELPKMSDDRRFELGPPCLHLGENAVFTVAPAGVWLAIGQQLHFLSLSLQTNLTVSLPAGSSPTALCLDGQRLWIGTDGDGLILYDLTTGKCRQHTLKTGLLMDEIKSLHLSVDCLWIGYGRQNRAGEGRGGLGRLELRSEHFSSFTPTLTTDFIPSTFVFGGRVEDPADRPPRSSVIQIASGPSGQIVLNVAHAGVRRYLPDKDQWMPLPFKDLTSVPSFAANSEHIIAGLVISRWDVLFKDNQPPRKNVTAPEFDRMLEDPTLFKRIRGRKQVWQPALGIFDSGNGPPRIVADDGSLPANPQLLVLEGSDLVVAGEAYILIYDLKQMRVRKLAHIPTRSVDKIQVGAGFLWVQFDRHLYRTALTQIQPNRL